MKLDRTRRLFFGMKIDAKLREGLSRVAPNDRKYFEGTEYLTVTGDGEDHWVGKIVDSPVTADSVEDIKRNVVSILTRMLADVRVPREVSIFAVVDDMTERTLANVSYHPRTPGGADDDLIG